MWFFHRHKWESVYKQHLLERHSYEGHELLVYDSIEGGQVFKGWKAITKITLKCSICGEYKQKTLEGHI